MHSLKVYVDTLAGLSKKPVSVEQCIEGLSSAGDNVLQENKARAVSILNSLAKVIKNASEKGNSEVIHACLNFLTNAANDDDWMIEFGVVILDTLVNLAYNVCVGTGFVSRAQIDSKSLSYEEELDAFDSVIVSCNLAAHLFKLFLLFFEFESPKVKAGLNDIHKLACLVVFRLKDMRPEDGDSELCYAIDCLDRSACFVISNAVEAFPEAIDSLHSILKDSRHCLLTLLKEASESSIQRSLTRMCSVLFNHRNASKRFKFSTFRSSIRRDLQNRFRSVHGWDLFQEIDVPSPEGDDQEEVIQNINSFCEAVKNAANREHFFVVNACSVTFEGTAFRNVSTVEFDASSVAVCVPDGEPIRVPWYALEEVFWTTGTSVSIESAILNSKTVQIEFDSTCSENGSIAEKVRLCLMARTKSKLLLNTKSAASSLPKDDISNHAREAPDKRVVENQAIEDGKNITDQVTGFVLGCSNAKPIDRKKREQEVDEMDSNSDRPATTSRKAVDGDETRKEHENDSHKWLYSPASDSDGTKDNEMDWDKGNDEDSEVVLKEVEDGDEESEFLWKLGKLIGNGLKIRKRKTLGMIEKSRSRVEEMRIRHKKEEERATVKFLKSIEMECKRHSEMVNEESKKIVEKLEKASGVIVVQKTGLGASKRQLSGVVGRGEKKMEECTMELDKKLGEKYEECVAEKKKRAEAVDGLFRGISELLSS